MFFSKDYTKSVVHSTALLLNRRNALLSFWDGIEIPTRSDLLEVGHANLGVYGFGTHFKAALDALGGREIHQTLIRSINVTALEKTTFFNFAASGSEDTTKLTVDETATPVFAVLSFTGSNETSWDDDQDMAAYTFILSVGDLESGADLAIVDTTFNPDTQIRVGTFTFNLI